jgi:hypothetical protein
LYYALREDRTPYSYEFVDPGDERRGADLRAVQRWLSQDFGVYDLVADMPWPAHTPPSTVMPVLLRGREELRAVVRTLSEMLAVPAPADEAEQSPR